jgi:hypothetical protein
MVKHSRWALGCLVLVGVIGCKKEVSVPIADPAPATPTTRAASIPDASTLPAPVEPRPVAAAVPATTRAVHLVDSGLQSLFDALLQLKADVNAKVGRNTIEPHLSAAQLAFDKWEPGRDSSMRSQTCASGARRAISAVIALAHNNDPNVFTIDGLREDALKEIESFRKSFESAP